MKSKFYYIFGDLLMLFLAFLITSLLKDLSSLLILQLTIWVLTIFTILWIALSLLTGKYNHAKLNFEAKTISKSILFSNTIILGLVSILVYFFHLLFTLRRVPTGLKKITPRENTGSKCGTEFHSLLLFIRLKTIPGIIPWFCFEHLMQLPLTVRINSTISDDGEFRKN